MKKFFGAAVAVAASFVAVQPASAYHVLDGAITCETVLQEDANESYALANKWWLTGYITGRNYAADASVGEGVDTQQIYRDALEYCRSNPSALWDDAAIYMYDQLSAGGASSGTPRKGQ